MTSTRQSYTSFNSYLPIPLIRQTSVFTFTSILEFDWISIFLEGEVKTKYRKIPNCVETMRMIARYEPEPGPNQTYLPNLQQYHDESIFFVFYKNDLTWSSFSRHFLI